VALQLFLPKNLREKIIKQKFSLEDPSPYSYTKNEIALSPEQTKAYQSIYSAKNNKTLLYGVTGSGKTQIYMQLIADMLKE
jgi:primosomal protein N' (replication factor Y) (superfamily II helicase)